MCLTLGNVMFFLSHSTDTHIDTILDFTVQIECVFLRPTTNSADFSPQGKLRLIPAIIYMLDLEIKLFNLK